jgi:CubicO group peptidase (beta-lactamase class C family)
MCRFLLALAIGILSLGGVPLHSADLVLDRFRDYLESLRVQAGIPGLAAAIVGTDDIVWEHAFGRQNIEQSIATRTDTPFQLDELTQVFTAALVLRCVEAGRLSLDDPIGRFRRNSADPNQTIQQILTHTTGTADKLVYDYDPERLEPLTYAIRACTGDSFRETLGNLLDRLAMRTSVPGSDAVSLVPPTEGIPSRSTVERYRDILERLATPYTVDQQGRVRPSQYEARTLTAAGGLVSTVRDLAQFDLALRRGVLLRSETLAAAWRAPLAPSGQRLPHGLGWFVQTYNGEMIAWQFGVSHNASSSLMVTVPARGFTLILLANSSGLVRSSTLTAGDLTASPFGRLFLGFFAR